MDKKTAPELEFAKTAEEFIYRISMVTKGPIHRASTETPSILPVAMGFHNFHLPKRISLIDDETAAELLLKQWKTFFGLLEIVITNAGHKNRSF